MAKEYEIWTRFKDGTHRGSLQRYDNYGHCKEWFDYLCTSWREELKTKADEEDLMKTNWATRTWNEKKDEKFFIVEREVGPYIIIQEEENE